MIIKGVSVEIIGGSMSLQEAEYYIADELQQWKKKGKILGRVILSICGDEIEIKSFEKSPIARIRRITGYLSTEDRFNSSKQAELHDRVSHL